jgi:hypothetical protein
MPWPEMWNRPEQSSSAPVCRRGLNVRHIDGPQAEISAFVSAVHDGGWIRIIGQPEGVADLMLGHFVEILVNYSIHQGKVVQP